MLKTLRDILDGQEAISMNSQQLNAIVAQRIEVTPGLIILRVVPEGWELPDFTAGQFSVLGLPGSAPRCEVCDTEEDKLEPGKLQKRAYSIASSSVAKEFMEFYISLVPSGVLTPRLFALNRGNKVWLSPKATGLFTLDEVPVDKNVVFVSTGTGLASVLIGPAWRLSPSSRERRSNN